VERGRGPPRLKRPVGAADEADMNTPTHLPTRRLARLLAALSVAALLLFAALPGRAAAGQIVADLGFRPDPDGFSFPNYGDEEGYANLDAGEMQRLFGPSVCVAGKGARCVLTPTARAWMQSVNEDMAGGHCYGFAVLTELIHKRQLPEFGVHSLAAFGSGPTPFSLAIDGNVALQRAIARAWSFQMLESVNAAVVRGAPSRILRFLVERALSPTDPETWTLTIFRRDGTGGHAITPYAVEDMGNGIYQVHVYDNNWPGDTGRRVTIDTVNDTWRYYAATRPGLAAAEYEGDAQTQSLALHPTRPGLGVQPCPICVGRQGAGSRYNEIRLQGGGDEHGHLLIVDSKGRKTGRVGKRIVNQIPGARVLRRTSSPKPLANGALLFRDSLEPVYRIPRGVKFKLRVSGRHMRTTTRESLTLVGPTYDATVQNLVMGPGQVANVHLAPRRQALTYRASRGTSVPTVSLGAESERAAYNVSVSAVDAKPRSTLMLVKRPRQRLMWIGDKTTRKRRYQVTIRRFTVNSQARFGARFTIGGHQQAFLYYGPLAREGKAKIAIYTPSRDRVRVIPVKRLD